jgi:hypothetical protein
VIFGKNDFTGRGKCLIMEIESLKERLGCEDSEYRQFLWEVSQWGNEK